MRGVEGTQPRTSDLLFQVPRFLALSGASRTSIVVGVQAALFLGGPAPASGALILAKHHRPRAGPAADARVSLVVQRIVRNVVVRDQLPDVLLSPGGQRADLDQAEEHTSELQSL